MNKDDGIHEVIMAFAIGAMLMGALFNAMRPADEPNKDAKVCVTYEQSTGKCVEELTVGKIIDKYIAEANK